MLGFNTCFTAGLKLFKKKQNIYTITSDFENSDVKKWTVAIKGTRLYSSAFFCG